MSMGGPSRTLTGRVSAYARLIRLDRPIGTWLLLWPTLWALWISSGGRPDEEVFLIFVIGKQAELKI